MNVRFLMMEHEGADGSVTANTQTAPEEIESGDKATQTTEQAVMLDEAQRFFFFLKFNTIMHLYNLNFAVAGWRNCLEVLLSSISKMEQIT